LPVTTSGAQRASITRSVRLAVFTLVASLVVGLGAMASPPETSAASIKVVIVVGPVGSKTEEYRTSARYYARLARGYGATVTEIYSPYATWTKVKSALQGANMLIYLGHGNGYPSPYGSFQKYTKDGMGLNATSGNGNSNVKYWGEYYIDRDIQMAKNAVVLLNRLCYASGNSEWGAANPTKSTAIKRVDNYGAGFLRAGARVVFAEAIGSISHQIRALLTGGRSMEGVFTSHPDMSDARNFYVMSSRTSWAKMHLDPPKVGKYWRSVIGDLRMTAVEFRGG
jgi:hypothetical protein